MDVRGIQIKSLNTTGVDLAEVDVSGPGASSIYFIQVYVSGENRTFKFIKK